VWYSGLRWEATLLDCLIYDIGWYEYWNEIAY
jgi:hypothetical protein